MTDIIAELRAVGLELGERIGGGMEGDVFAVERRPDLVH